MKKLNKKGFTLIEMLVVIAIIAILVAIIIPTVSSATGKAKASTDAANLRSAKAALTIEALNGEIKDGDTPSAAHCKVPGKSKYDEKNFSATVVDTSKSGTGDKNTTGLEITVKYGEHGIVYYAALADGKTEADAEALEAAGVEEEEETSR